MDTSRGSPQDCHKPLKKRKARYILTTMAKVPEEEDEPTRPRILRKSRKTMRNEPEMSKISTDSGENQQTLPIKKRSHKSPVGTPMKDSNETGKAARAARGPKKKIRKMETTPKKRYIPTGRPRGRPRLSDELRLERRKHRKSYYIPNGRPRGRPRGSLRS